MIWLSILSLMVVVPLTLINTVLLVEIALGLVPARGRQPLSGPTPLTVLLMPAHNEAVTLARYGAQIAALATPHRRVVLIADNCTDTTAADARALGIEVVERVDQNRRGKGYALAFGRDHLALNPPEVALVLDADCLADPAALDLLAARAMEADRPVQAAYLFRPALEAAPSVQISNFAFAVKNRVRQRGGQRIGAAAVLTGSGMAFPWLLFATLDLATGNVVEDLALGIALIKRSCAPIYEDRAVVWSDCSVESGTLVQRSRWEGGFIATAWRFAGSLISGGIIRADWKRVWMGFHLLVPPLSLLLAINVAALAILSGLALLTAPVAPTILLITLLFGILLALLGAWWVEGRRQVRGATLVRVPWYLLWKLALLLRIARGQQRVAWHRTKRPDH